MDKRRNRGLRRLVLVGALASSPIVSAQSPTSSVVSDSRSRALQELRAGGPVRFGVVNERVYRGGQPTAHHLELLRELGVETVIDLRRSDARAEEAEAQRLGMRVLRFPFYGPFGAKADFLARIVEALRTGGRVYVHCQQGRDRTSLVVALYRVFVDGWAPDEAWAREATAYGYRRGLFYGAIERSFRAAVAAQAGRRP